MTPQLQISTAGVYLFPAKISGAKKQNRGNYLTACIREGNFIF